MPREQAVERAKQAYDFASAYNEHIDYLAKIKHQINHGAKIYQELADSTALPAKEREAAQKYADDFRAFCDNLPDVSKMKLLDTETIVRSEINSYTDEQETDYIYSEEQLTEYSDDVLSELNLEVSSENIRKTMTHIHNKRFDLYGTGGLPGDQMERAYFTNRLKDNPKANKA